MVENSSPKIAYFSLIPPSGTTDERLEPILDMLHCKFPNAYAAYELSTNCFKTAQDILDTTKGSDAVILDIGCGWSEQKNTAFKLFIDAIPAMSQKTILYYPEIIHVIEPGNKNSSVSSNKQIKEWEANFDTIVDGRVSFFEDDIEYLLEALDALGVSSLNQLSPSGL